MTNKFCRKLTKLTFIFSFCLLITSTSSAAVKPASGDLYHNGLFYLDSYFGWYTPGPWPGSGPGFEMDLRTQDNYFVSGVTVYGNLPSFYDDSSTSGISDPPGYRIDSGGSYNASAIQANYSYYVAWNFVQNIGSVASSVQLYSQAVEHNFCPFNIPWCMNGVNNAVYQTALIPPPTLYLIWLGNPNVIYW